MAYVSNCLTHWVGRGKPVDEQYRILTECILIKRQLLYGSAPWHFSSKYGGLKKDRQFTIPMVCFTDIPFSECVHHCQRYSEFGVSFDKVHLVNCLASPVGYALNPLIFESYSYISHTLHGIRGLVDGKTIPDGLRKGEGVSIHDLLRRFQYMCGFLEQYSEREFDFAENRPEPREGQEEFFEDPSALYYEREWRMALSEDAKDLRWNECCGGKYYFTFGEQYLKYVIVPREYIDRFRKEEDNVFADYRVRPSVLLFEDLKHF